jgi:hypothetical protein
VGDAEGVEVEAPTCPNCGAPLELLGDSTCRWCHVLVERHRPPPQTFQSATSDQSGSFGGQRTAAPTVETVDLGDYRSFSEPFATLLGWVDTLRQPPIPAGLCGSGATAGFIHLIARVREHIARISGVAWDDRSIPRAVRQDLESLLPALLDLVEAMSATAACDRQVCDSARASVGAMRQQLGRDYRADPKHVRKAFETFPDLGTWVAAALSSSS